MSLSPIKLQKPLFYDNPYGLRFEIGPADLHIWVDFDRGILNRKYFEVALDRSITIWESAFATQHNIAIAYQIRSDGRQRIHRGNYLFNQITHLDTRQIKFSSRRDLYTDDLEFKRDCWQRVVISHLTVADLNYQNLLQSLVNTDFSLRRQPALRGECFVINRDTGLVLNLYDDHGMDIVAPQKSTLETLYHKHNDWLLDFDRERINQIFA